ncbi:MAG: DsbA family protein, partial [Pseudomonadota bacterium]
GEAVVMELFDRYFRRGEDISDRDLLADVAEAAGMERGVVERLLAGDADRQALEEEEKAAREMGVTGVPCFIIQGKYVIQGAQDTATWRRVIDEIADAATAQPEEAETAAPQG